jgi:hypothetical protein
MASPRFGLDAAAGTNKRYILKWRALANTTFVT